MTGQRLSREQINTVIDSLNYKYKESAQNLLRFMYLTGCSPKEAMSMKAGDIKKKGKYLLINIQTSKSRSSRTIYLKLSDPMVEELYGFHQRLYPGTQMFYGLKSNTTTTTKQGTGYTHSSHNLNYWFNKWFSMLEEPYRYTPKKLSKNFILRMESLGLSKTDIGALKGLVVQGVDQQSLLSVKRCQEIAALMANS